MEHNNTVDEKELGDERQRLESWLPVTASREAKWWYSTFHNVTAMVGAGVLGLPFAVSQLGWVPGVLAVILSWVVTLYSLWQLVELHEVVPGKRFDRYHQLGQHAFGPKLGYWIVMPQQMLVQIGSDLVYNVTGGKSMKKVIDLLLPKARGIRETYYIILFTALQFVVSQTPNFNSLKGVSLLAAIMSFGYSAVAFIASLVKGSHHHPTHYGVRSHTTTGKIFDALNAMGTVAFAYAGHSVALEIQATIPSTPEVPSRKPMWKGVVVSYAIVISCYLSVAVAGFWAFGDDVEDDVLISLHNPAWLIAAANFMVFLHVVGSYQVFAMPVFDSLESFLVKNLHFNPSFSLRLIARSLYVAIVGFVAVCIPFFGGLLGFFGGLVFASTSYFLPSVIWLILKRPRLGSVHWFASWICVIIGLLIAVLSPIGGARQIALQAKSYKVFS